MAALASTVSIKPGVSSLAYQSTLRPTKILSTKISKICCGTSRGVSLHHSTLTKINYVGWAESHHQ